jgi:hypothetical protein
MLENCSDLSVGYLKIVDIVEQVISHLSFFRRNLRLLNDWNTSLEQALIERTHTDG